MGRWEREEKREGEGWKGSEGKGGERRGGGKRKGRKKKREGGEPGEEKEDNKHVHA